MMHSQQSVAEGQSMVFSNSCHNLELCRGVSPGCDCYITRDVLTDPPTSIQILFRPLLESVNQSPLQAAILTIGINDIEPTAGWLSDRNNASLDICFMHSFGKCSGKIRNKDPSTCHQIHVNREVLNNLRKLYALPQRQYFCRTMKANVTERFAQLLSLLAKRRFTLQYLEFRTEDIDVTAGSTLYEVEYRRWLVGGPEVSQKSLITCTGNYMSTSILCWDFALTGSCPRGVACSDLHGHIAKALTKDRYVKLVLEEIGHIDLASHGAPLSQYLLPSQQLTPQLLPPALPVALNPVGAPPYGQIASPNGQQFQMATNALHFLPPPPISTQQFGEMPNAAYYIISEGSDHVVRLLPMALHS